MRLTFLGASGTVTGSQYLLESPSGRILVDCGLFQGYKQLRLRNWSPPSYEPADIGAVVLTHAHLDHSGYLPRLARNGFTGPIYCTQGTFELCRILLPDSAHLQQEDAKYANDHGYSKHSPALPLYTAEDVEQCLGLFRPVAFHESFEPVAGFRAELHVAGHLLGAAFARIHCENTTVTFTGDLGRPHDPVMNEPEQPQATDFLVTESTYGDRTHPPLDPEAELARWLAPACARGGVTIVPAFAVGRTQAVLLHIARLKERGVIPDVPVYLDSPMAIDATAIYRRFCMEHRLTAKDCERLSRAARMVRTPEESKELDRRTGPMIIVAGSGMATGGRVVHHLKLFATDPRNLILLAGFQAPGTRGAALMSGSRTLRVHGGELTVRAQVAQLHASSAHADADELSGWMRRLPRAPSCTFVTHGEPGASDALRYRIEHELGWRARVPEYRDVADLTPRS
jgi:metallo-beta-lactamase family protein